MWDEIEPMQREIEMSIRKLRAWKNSNFFFGWRGPLVMIFGGVGAGGWQGARWQGSGVQKGQMAGKGGGSHHNINE